MLTLFLPQLVSYIAHHREPISVAVLPKKNTRADEAKFIGSGFDIEFPVRVEFEPAQPFGKVAVRSRFDVDVPWPQTVETLVQIRPKEGSEVGKAFLEACTPCSLPASAREVKMFFVGDGKEMAAGGRFEKVASELVMRLGFERKSWIIARK